MGGDYRVAVYDNELIAFVVSYPDWEPPVEYHARLQPFLREARTGYLGPWGVDPEYRYTDVGVTLGLIPLRKFVNQGIQQACLMVGHNEGPERLYRKFGFVQIGEMFPFKSHTCYFMLSQLDNNFSTLLSKLEKRLFEQRGISLQT